MGLYIYMMGWGVTKLVSKFTTKTNSLSIGLEEIIAGC